MIPLLMCETDEPVSAEYLGRWVPLLLSDPLAPMCRHKDTHQQAWTEPVSTAKPALAALGIVAPLGRR